MCDADELSEILRRFRSNTLTSLLITMGIEKVLWLITEIQENQGGMVTPYLWHRMRLRFGLVPPPPPPDESYNPYQPRRSSPEDYYTWEWPFAAYIEVASIEDLKILYQVLDEDLTRRGYADANM